MLYFIQLRGIFLKNVSTMQNNSFSELLSDCKLSITERRSDWNDDTPRRASLLAELDALKLKCADFCCFCEHLKHLTCIFCYTDFTDPRDGPVEFGPDWTVIEMPEEALKSVAACLAYDKTLDKE